MVLQVMSEAPINRPAAIVQHKPAEELAFGWSLGLKEQLCPRHNSLPVEHGGVGGGSRVLMVSRPTPQESITDPVQELVRPNKLPDVEVLEDDLDG